MYAVRLFVNCRAYAFDPVTRRYARRDALLVEGARIAGLDASLAGAGVERVDLQGATIVPAFADCHVHLTDTGLKSGARDLSGATNAAAFYERIAALPAGEIVFAGKYDDAAWPSGSSASAEPLERFHAERRAMLTRVDGHSCLVNRATLSWLALDASLAGVERDAAGEPTGRLFGGANFAAQTKFLAGLPERVRREAERHACELALAQGALHLHVQLIGFEGRAGYAREIAALRALPGAKWYPKICERDPEMAAELGLPFVGGDVFLDGSLGSGTAAIGAPYCDRPGNGSLFLSDAEVFEFFAGAERAGISAGVHAIGDRAIEQCLAAWERVLAGPSTQRRTRHFIEHFELASAAQIERAANLGLHLSMQPQFDAAWGGPEGMYAQRLGPERAHAMNALRSARDAGATLCGGSDAPVCDLSPLRGMAAACAPHNAEHALTPLEALTMYTYDAACLGHAETRTGLLRAGCDADFVVLDRDPFADGSFGQARVLATYGDGVRVTLSDSPQV